jgi:hypothetical protein
MVAHLVARYGMEAMVVPLVGSGGVCVRVDSRVRRSVFCLCVLQEYGFGCREESFVKIFFLNIVISIRFAKIKLQ